MAAAPRSNDRSGRRICMLKVHQKDRENEDRVQVKKRTKSNQNEHGQRSLVGQLQKLEEVQFQ